MRALKITLVSLMSGLLVACGGGSGGSGGGALPLPPGAATNSIITNLVADQVFSGPAATSDSEFDLASAVTLSSGGGDANLTVAYDAAQKSYTVSVSGRSQTFRPADVISNANGEVRYQKDGAAGRDRLTLVTTPYSGGASNRYVGMGYWQRSSVVSSRQSDRFATFVYGLETSAASMPRTGQARFGIDVFGLATIPGFEPSVLQGEGEFNVDFMAGVFSTRASLYETGLLTGEGVFGGGIELQGAGLLSSSASSFSGNVTVGSRNANLTGSLAGRFYGPAADELGATFSASGGSGTIVGSFTGQRREGPAANLTLTNIVAPETFFAHGTALFVETVPDRPGAGVRTQRMIGQFRDQTGGQFTFSPGYSHMAGGTFTPDSIVGSSDPNFTTHQATFGEADVRLDLYKVGQSNSELSLTYSSLGRWRSLERAGVGTTIQHHHFVYGLETPQRLLASRTGSARYEGVVYGAAAVGATGEEFDVRGASVFDVNFSRQSYSGDLTLNGRNDNRSVDFGRYDFSGQLGARTSIAIITRNGVEVGDLETRFFGPSGEEIGGDFSIRSPEDVHEGVIITGVTVARRQ
ncbi:hypothetical protein IWC96_04945 [Brevundimonas sp. BAL450]|uniref:transferrin-binding protein-like solute binding protein n=1 Tax=Brevundimonas sp. BAL450 TaxID=1708162 RepID=UPI0018CBD8E6|nr:transferrin-binding protein-like solute binding protein [Brevundimonas sp. BAL450]MBG7614628.1 hypothetical protein [Brevundimonas sp. BAL450]